MIFPDDEEYVCVIARSSLLRIAFLAWMKVCSRGFNESDLRVPNGDLGVLAKSFGFSILIA